jgi:hypothetical protein
MSAIPAGLPRWRAVLYDGHSIGLAADAETFFRVAVEPSCRAIVSELGATSRGPDNPDFDRWDRLRNTQLELHRSFAMALGGMWERHFRRHLAHSASVIGPKGQPTQRLIEQGDWAKLSSIFEEVRGFSLKKFPSHDQLYLLHRVTSAVRHGNGKSTQVLFGSHPELFAHEPIRCWFSYATLGGEPDHSIHRLEITLNQLGSFKDAIVNFWQLIRNLQASSEY